jgi:tRNA G10  N-methylase Trm11
VIIKNNKAIVAISEGAQNITAYAKRDQNRPKRDAFVGMLPPKLAQTMINLAVGPNQPQIWLQNRDFAKIDGKTPKLLDPFCGTGTVLQEAILKGFTAYGSDLNPKMVDYTKENIKWLEKSFRPHGKFGYSVIVI